LGYLYRHTGEQYRHSSLSAFTELEGRDDKPDSWEDFTVRSECCGGKECRKEKREVGY
jgi:hypothetical protein